MGKAFIFSAPSGSGKTTIVKHLLETHSNLAFSVSACTRQQRPNEVHGKDYYFITPEEFRKKILNDEFVEWEEVYENNFYGTLKSEIERIWESGRHVVFDVDVVGGLKLKKYFKDKALAVFVKVSSLQELELRLKLRQTETEENLAKRLDKVRYELSFEDQFDISLINETLPITLRTAKELIDEFVQK